MTGKRLNNLIMFKPCTYSNGFMSQIGQEYLVIKTVWALQYVLTACLSQRAVHKDVKTRLYNALYTCIGGFQCIVTAWKFDRVWTDPAWWFAHALDGQRKRGRFDATPWCNSSSWLEAAMYGTKTSWPVYFQYIFWQRNNIDTNKLARQERWYWRRRQRLSKFMVKMRNYEDGES